MKRRSIAVVLVLVLLGMVLALAGCSAPAAAPPVDKAAIAKEAAAAYLSGLPANSNILPPEEVKALVTDSPDSLQVVDIRSAADYAKGHIVGAINMPFKEVGAKMDDLPKGKMLVVACYSGQTAGQTVAALNIAGYNAKSLKSGMSSWDATKGFEVVTN